MPMMRAEYAEYPALGGVRLAVLNWPMPALQLRGRDSGAIIDAADRITAAWDNYSDEALGIYAFYKRRKAQHHNPDNAYGRRRIRAGAGAAQQHNKPGAAAWRVPSPSLPPSQKKENIGLIEVMGLFILPGRLKEELEQTARYLSGMPFDETRRPRIFRGPTASAINTIAPSRKARRTAAGAGGAVRSCWATLRCSTMTKRAAQGWTAL